MEAIASKDIILLADITHDFFSPIDKILWTLDDDSKGEFSNMLKAVIVSIMYVVQRQYKNDYLMEITDEIGSKLTNARTHYGFRRK